MKAILEGLGMFVAFSALVYLVLHFWENKENQRQAEEMKQQMRRPDKDWDV